MPASLLTLLLITAGLSLGSGAESREFVVGQTVQTSNGPISGHAASHATHVSEYLGIPFAEPPVGDLRFAPPVKYKGTDGQIFNASTATLACPAVGAGAGIASQPFVNTITFGTNGIQIIDEATQADMPVVEDCLTLNIWTKPQSGEQRKAVLVWIYGGGNTYGSANLPLYNGQFLAGRQDVVVVTINYRTNIFGFTGAPNLPEHNAGLMDQRMAILWIRDNIAAFGGDPSRITLFGQSAGGAALDYYSVAYYDNDPIVNGFIQESGNALGTVASADDAASSWYRATSNAGCGDAFSPDQAKVLACMRDLPVSNILQSMTGASFGPSADGIQVFNDTMERVKSGRLINRPILLGNTDGEGGFLQPLAQSRIGIAIPQPLLDLLTLVSFTCPARTAAQYRLDNNITTWRYRWFGLFPNTVVSYQAPSGVYHASEIPIVFGTTKLLKHPRSPVKERKFIKYIQGAWAAFAKDPDNGLVKYGWPKYDPSTETLMQLGLNNMTGPNLANPTQYDAICEAAEAPSDVIAQIENLVGDLSSIIGSIIPFI